MPVRSISELIDQRFGLKTKSASNPVIATIGTTAGLMLRQNPSRIGFVVINVSANNLFIHNSNAVSSTQGLMLTPNGGSVSMVYDRDFTLCSEEWWCVGSAAGSTFLVIEVLIR